MKTNPSSLNSALKYATLMTIFYLLGSYLGSTLFGYGYLSLMLLCAAFIILCLRGTKNNRSKMMDFFFYYLKTGITSLGLFLILNLILSVKFNDAFKFSLEGPIFELPQIIVGLLVYGAWTTVFIFFVMLIKFLTQRKDYDLDDHLIDKD